MSSSFANTLTALFNAPLPNPHLTLIKALKASHASSQNLSVLQWSDSSFPLSGYLATVGILPEIIEPDTHSIVDYDKEKRITYTQVSAGVTVFTYGSTEFRAYKATWITTHTQQFFYHFAFDGADDSVGQKLVEEVFRWANGLREQIWVYEGGCWFKSKHLYQAVRAASWDDIVLDSKFKEGLKRDTETFFSSKDIYRSLGITWKRGILLLGPPGNGKTESIKALLKDAQCAVLYAKSFVTRQGPEQGVRGIFEHARQNAPCILVLEDLDAMVTDEVRSFFLNELDGLAQNDGILTIATTNHAERIDDAILNRPSRFDVKYNFSLPDNALREEFALKWMKKIHALNSDAGITFDNPEELAATVAEKTEGWSFAFLKELFVSFLLRVAHDSALRKKDVAVSAESSAALLLRQVDQLAAQIIRSKDDASQSKLLAGTAHPSMFRATRTMHAVPVAVSAHSAHAGTNF